MRWQPNLSSQDGMCSTSNTFAARRLRAAGAYPPLTRLEVRETRLKHRHTHVVTSGASSAPVSLHVRLLSVLKICGRHKTLTLSRADVEPLKKKKKIIVFDSDVSEYRSCPVW